MISLLLLLLGATPPLLSPEERSALASRELVARAEVGEHGADLLVAAVVVSTPDRVIDAALDPTAFLGGVRGVASVVVYERAADRVAARIEARALGISLTYHVIYLADRRAAVVRYALDPTRPNDVERLDGV